MNIYDKMDNIVRSFLHFRLHSIISQSRYPNLSFEPNKFVILINRIYLEQYTMYFERNSTTNMSVLFDQSIKTTFYVDSRQRGCKKGCVKVKKIYKYLLKANASSSMRRKSKFHRVPSESEISSRIFLLGSHLFVRVPFDITVFPECFRVNGHY